MRRPNAAKSIPKAMVCEATPQHAVEKKWELSAAARAPRTQATGASFICRKQNQAPSPRMNKDVGAKILEKLSGLVRSRIMDVRLRAGVGL